MRGFAPILKIIFYKKDLVSPISSNGRSKNSVNEKKYLMRRKREAKKVWKSRAKRIALHEKVEKNNY